MSELCGALRTHVETHFRRVIVEGELRGLQIQRRSGHAYFDLADRHAHVPVFMSAVFLRRLQFPLQDGLQVLLDGEVSIYEPRGRLQLRARRLEPVGEGARLLAFRARVAKLEAEGLTSPDRKKSWSLRPRPIGVVTSKNGAALRDVVRTAFRRDPNAHLLLAPAAVQGVGAVGELVRALQRLDQLNCGVVLVVRGGGSLEDLQAFNEEPVARAIARCRTPVVTGIGHETDTTLADLVADARASTPTAAAELVVSPSAQLQAQFEALNVRLRRALRARWLAADRDLQQLQLGLRAPFGRIAAFYQRLDELNARMYHASRRSLEHGRERVQTLEKRLVLARPEVRLQVRKQQVKAIKARLQQALQQRIDAERHRFEQAVGCLEALSPLAVLARGYAVVSTQESVVRDADDLQTGDVVQVRLHRGKFRAKVLSE